jgi:hypothetical protein
MNDHVQRTPTALEPVSARRALARASDLVGGIAHDTKEIIDGYLELAKLDLRAELDRAKSSVALGLVGLAILGAAGVLLLVGLCLALALWLGLHPWITFVAVGGVSLAAGAVVAVVARHQARQIEAPRAIEEGKEDVAWIAEHT